MNIRIKACFLHLVWLIAGAPLLFAAAKPHVVFLGSSKSVPYSVTADPAGALPAEKQLRVRP